jgi:hypothetical protein
MGANFSARRRPGQDFGSTQRWRLSRIDADSYADLRCGLIEILRR